MFLYRNLEECKNGFLMKIKKKKEKKRVKKSWLIQFKTWKSRKKPAKKQSWVKFIHTKPNNPPEYSAPPSPNKSTKKQNEKPIFVINLPSALRRWIAIIMDPRLQTQVWPQVRKQGEKKMVGRNE